MLCICNLIFSCFYVYSDHFAKEFVVDTSSACHKAGRKRESFHASFLLPCSRIFWGERIDVFSAANVIIQLNFSASGILTLYFVAIALVHLAEYVAVVSSFITLTI